MQFVHERLTCDVSFSHIVSNLKALEVGNSARPVFAPYPICHCLSSTMVSVQTCEIARMALTI